MGSLVRLSPSVRISSYLGTTECVKLSADSMAALIPVKLSEDDKQNTIKANSRATLFPAVKLNIKTLNVIVSVNPVILSKGVAQCPSMLSPGEELVVEFTAYKQLDLSELEYLVKLFVID